MKTLAIGNDTKNINFAIFYGNKLLECGKIENEVSGKKSEDVKKTGTAMDDKGNVATQNPKGYKQ